MAEVEGNDPMTHKCQL